MVQAKVKNPNLPHSGPPKVFSVKPTPAHQAVWEATLHSGGVPRDGLHSPAKLPPAEKHRRPLGGVYLAPFHPGQKDDGDSGTKCANTQTKCTNAAMAWQQHSIVAKKKQNTKKNCSQNCK